MLNHDAEVSRHAGDVTAFLALVLDGLVRRLEEQTRAEEGLAKALSERENVLETIPDVIYTLDVDRRLSGWNRKLEVVTGLSSEELRGRRLAISSPRKTKRPSPGRSDPPSTSALRRWRAICSGRMEVGFSTCGAAFPCGIGRATSSG